MVQQFDCHANLLRNLRECNRRCGPEIEMCMACLLWALSRAKRGKGSALGCLSAYSAMRLRMALMPLDFTRPRMEGNSTRILDSTKSDLMTFFSIPQNKCFSYEQGA